MTTWIDAAKWDDWLQRAGYRYEVRQFYDEDADDPRFPLAEVAFWMEIEPEAMQDFLNAFRPDADDLLDMEARLKNRSPLADPRIEDIVGRWLARHQLIQLGGTAPEAVGAPRRQGANATEGES